MQVNIWVGTYYPRTTFSFLPSNLLKRPAMPRECHKSRTSYFFFANFSFFFAFFCFNGRVLYEIQEDEHFPSDRGFTASTFFMKFAMTFAAEINARRERVYELLTYSTLLFSPTRPEIGMNRWRSKSLVGSINGTILAYDFPFQPENTVPTIKTFTASTLRYTWWSIVPRGALYFTYVRPCHILASVYFRKPSSIFHGELLWLFFTILSSLIWI